MMREIQVMLSRCVLDIQIYLAILLAAGQICSKRYFICKVKEKFSIVFSKSL